MPTITATGPVYAQGIPNLTSNFILPPSFSKKWIRRFWPTDQLPWLCRSKYYDDATYGTTVEIPRDIDVTFSDFTIGMAPENMTIQRPDPEVVHLDIDQQHYAHIALSAIDKKLSPHDLAAKYQEAAQKAGKKKLNTLFHEWAATAAIQKKVSDVGNLIGTAANPVKINANGGGTADYSVTKLFTEIEQKFQDQDIDDIDGTKRLLMKPWMRTKMLNSELKMAGTMTRDAKSIYRSGYIGDPVAGMSVATSTSCYGSGANGSPTLVVAASDSGFAFTVRMAEADKFARQNHEDLLRLLLVWGRGVVEPRAIVMAWCENVADA